MWTRLTTVTVVGPTDMLLTVGATLRLTRLVTTDDLGEWLIGAPARAWAARHDGAAKNTAEETMMIGGTVYKTGDDIELPGEVDPDHGWRSKLVTGLDCQFCVGTWIGFGVLTATLATTPRSRVGRAWRHVMAGLTLNYASGHVSSRID